MSVLYRPLLVACLLVPTLVAVSSPADVDQYGDALPPGAVARLGTTRLRNPGGDITFSPDGKSLWTGRRVWDVSNGKQISELSAEDGHPLTVSPDGRTVAWTGRDDKLRLLEAAGGRLLHRIDGHKFSKTFFKTDSATFSPDGKVLATGGRDDLIRLWDVSTGKEVRTLDNPGRTEFLAYPPDGKTLVAVADGKARVCRLMDLATGKVLREWEHLRQPQALSADGKTLALGADGPQMRLWDVATGKEIRRFDVPDEEGIIQNHSAARSAALSQDGRLLAVLDLNRRVHVWDTGTGKELYCSPPVPGIGSDPLAFSPTGRFWPWEPGPESCCGRRPPGRTCSPSTDIPGSGMPCSPPTGRPSRPTPGRG